MPTVTIYLKGWRDSATFADAVNIESHPLHAEAMPVFHQNFMPYADGDVMYTAITYTSELTDDDVICEDAFRRFNIGERSDPVVNEYRGARNRSLSVGDVVVIDGRAYGCASFGWDRIETFTPTDAPR